MPPRIPNFPAHASRDVWQDRWLSPRSSRIAGSAPGATPHDRTPALPRGARGGALASPADGSAPVDERLRLGRGALSECLQAGAGAQGCSQHASPAPPAHPRAPPRGPVAVVDPQPMEPMRLLRLGLPVASAARSPRPALPRPAAHAHAVPALRQVSAELVDRAEGARGKGRDAIPMRGTSRMLAPSRTEYRSEHCARVSPAAWRDPQAERLLFLGGVVPCAVIERHPKLTAGVPPRERRTHTSLTYIRRRAEATPHLQRDARSGSRGRP